MFHSLQHGQRIAGDGIAIHRARPPPLMRTVTFPSSLSTRVANPLILCGRVDGDREVVAGKADARDAALYHFQNGGCECDLVSNFRR